MFSFTLDTWLWIIAAVIPLGMGALGGHVSSAKPLHRYIFWALGILGTAVVAFAGMRNQAVQTSLQNQLNAIQHNTETPPKVQITNQIMPAPVPKPSLASRPSAVELPAIQRLKNDDLRDKVINLTKDIRKLGLDEKANDEAIRKKDWAAWAEVPVDQKQKKQEAWNKIVEDEQYESTYFDFQVRQMYFGVATEYRNELLRRLPPQEPLSLNNQMMNFFWKMEENRPIASYSIEPTAQYLEALARQLPK